jgi:NDP-sugar pyrophosphorylase family protein
LDQQGIVRSFVEKPQEPKSNLAFAGIMVAGQEIFEYIPKKRPADIGFDLLPQLVGKMAAMKLCGYLRDIGTMENYTAAQADWPGLKRIAC